jgi:hypothetical protein
MEMAPKMSHELRIEFGDGDATAIALHRLRSLDISLKQDSDAVLLKDPSLIEDKGIRCRNQAD